MPQIVQISDDLLTALEEGGGLAPRTLKDRAKSYEDFKNFVKSEGHDINQLIAEGGMMARWFWGRLLVDTSSQ